MGEILYNEMLGDYTLKEEVEGVKSVKKIPVKFSLSDDTAKYRRQILYDKIKEKKE